MAEREGFLAEPTHENPSGEDGPVLPTCGFSRDNRTISTRKKKTRLT